MPTQERQPLSLAPLLAELAGLYGVEPRYRDTKGRWRESPAASVVMVLRALGADLGDPTPHTAAVRLPNESCLTGAIQKRRLELWHRVLEPVLVAWDGILPDLTVRLPQRGSQPGRGAGRSGGIVHGALELTLTMEEGADTRWCLPWASLALVQAETLGRTCFEARRASAREPGRLPLGYHRLRAEVAGWQGEATVISTPRRCWSPCLEREGPATNGAASDQPRRRSGPEWGVFAPLYALRSERNWGAGDLGDLEVFCHWVGAAGGSVVATLPLLASYLDTPFEPSPYRPVSRLFWNEFYLAVERIPEWERCTAAREAWASAAVQERMVALRAAPLVDYRETMALKRRVVNELSRFFFDAGEGERREAFFAYIRTHPEANGYAAFRAAVEAAGGDWRTWPDGPPGGIAGRPRFEGTGAPVPTGAQEAERYHLYCQWQMEEQLAGLAGGATSTPQAGRCSAGPTGARRERGLDRQYAGLFLDMPLGGHPGGFDTWRWPELFAERVSAGAPPDTFFTLGQNWESPPLHPERIREQGHEYFAACLRHEMRHARYLRIDHVAALHRLFWVPEGIEPIAGVYVSYPAEELYAVLCLESNRNRTVVVGEDLGTVPPGVRSSMRRHQLLGTYVLQTSPHPRGRQVIDPVPRHVVASLNTHDMYPFAGFLHGDDIGARVRTGQLEPMETGRELSSRRRLVRRLAEFLPMWQREGEDREETAGPGAGRRCLAPAVATMMQSAVNRDCPLEAELTARALNYLETSDAALVLVNFEDLLLETRPQNLPGTGAESGNWARKTARSVEQVLAS